MNSRSQEESVGVEPPEKTLSSTPDSGLGEDVKEDSKLAETEAKLFPGQAEETNVMEEISTDPAVEEDVKEESKLAETEAKLFPGQAEETKVMEEISTDPDTVEAPVTNSTEPEDLPDVLLAGGSPDIAEETPADGSVDQIDNPAAVSLESDLADHIGGPSAVMTSQSQSQSRVKINTPEPQSREEVEKPIRKTPHPLSRVNTLKKQESGDVTRLSLKPNYDSHDDLEIDDEEEEELQKLSWDSDNEERIDLGLEDGTSCKVEAWDTNSDNGKYLTGIEAQRVIVEGMRKKVETMKTLLTPGYSNQGSVFNFPSASVGMRKSISSSGDCDEVFRGNTVKTSQRSM